MADVAGGAGRGRLVGRMVGLAVLAFAALAAVGVWAWQRYDPFFAERPEVRKADALRGAARGGPLTDEQFADALGLLGSGTPAAQLTIITTVEVDAARTPDRRGRAVEALRECERTAEPPVGPAAGAAAGRLAAGPKKE